MKKISYLLLILSVLIFSGCKLDEPETSESSSTIYTQLTSSTSAYETAALYYGTKIYYRTNLNTTSSNTYDIWRMDPDSFNDEKVVNFATTGWGARTGGNFSIYNNQLYFYSAISIHEVLAVDLGQTLPLNITSYIGSSVKSGVTQALAVPGGYGSSSVTIHEATKKAVWTARISPNGAKLISYSLRTVNISDLKGGSTKSTGEELIKAKYISDQCSFSPDGSKAAVALVKEGASDNIKPDIYIIDTTSGEILQQLTDEGEVGISSNHPAWSPDGSSIAFDRLDLDGNYQIYTVSSSGSNLKQITSKDVTDPASLKFETSSWLSPIWIGSSKLIIHRNGSSFRQIWKIDL